MSIFERKKIDLLKKKIDIQKKISHDKEKFSLFDTKFATDIFSGDSNYNYLKSMYDIIESWEGVCNLPYNVGVSLDKLASDNVVMCHRTNLGLNKEEGGLEYNEDLLNIMEEGLKNYGHMNAAGGSAFSNTPPSLNLTMTPLEGLTGYINLVGPYNSNDVIILCAFPKEFVKKDGEVVNQSNYYDIYDLGGDVATVKKEYMLGAILKKDNGLDEFYTRDEVIKALSRNNSI